MKEPRASRHFIMESSDYVARRILFEILDIATPIDERFESIYEVLYDWMESYSEQFGDAIFYRLPGCKTTRDELLRDMAQLYAGIIARVSDVHSITTLHALFTVTFYMMVKYKERQPSMCGDIVYYFKLITQRLESWNTLEHLTNNGARA